MRIITGKYKGRHFDIPRSFKARPTTDFAKENIFNVLTQYIDFDGADALDLFSGTGSITLELLSRGCREVVSIEQDRDHHRFITDCLKKLGVATRHSVVAAQEQGGVATRHSAVAAQEHSGVNSYGDSTEKGIAANAAGFCLPIRGDVFRFLKSCRQQFDFIFADPPYALRELQEIPDLVLRQEGQPLLRDGGIFVFEHGGNHDFSQHPRFLEHRAYGSVNFSLFR